MKDYDIFLKKHIHDTEVLIYALPYRDGISVTYRIILEAMLSYYTLQKMIAIENKSELVSEIDKIILTISEKVKSGIEVKGELDLFKHTEAELEQTALELNIPELPAFMRSFFQMENLLAIRVSDAEADIISMLGDIENQIVVNANDLETFLASYGGAEHEIGLQTEMEGALKRSYAEIANDVGLSMADFNLIYSYLIGGEVTMLLVAEISDALISSYLNGVENSIGITMKERANSAVKSIRISNSMVAFCEMAATVIYYFQSSNDFTVTVKAESRLKRFRRLAELDNLTLGELDDQILEELDYIIIAD